MTDTTKAPLDLVTVRALHAHQDKAAGLNREAGEAYLTTHDRAIERESAGLVRILSAEEAAALPTSVADYEAVKRAEELTQEPPATIPAAPPTSEAPPVPLGDGPAETTDPPAALETTAADAPETKEQT